MDEQIDTFSINSDLLDEMVNNSGKKDEDYLNNLLNMGETSRNSKCVTAIKIIVGMNSSRK